MTDRLFVLRPGFVDADARYFCPFSAQIVGFLTYYPEVRATVEVVELDYPRPRAALVALLGERHQSPPILVLAGPPVPVAGVHVAEAGGTFYVEKTLEILRYLAATRGLPGPH